MKTVTGYITLISSRLRWLFMTPPQKYACLWAKTKKLGDGGSAARYAATIANK
jgi:hypothetical protein